MTQDALATLLETMRALDAAGRLDEAVAVLETAARSTNTNTGRSARAGLGRIPGHPLWHQAREERAEKRRRRRDR